MEGATKETRGDDGGGCGEGGSNGGGGARGGWCGGGEGGVGGSGDGEQGGGGGSGGEIAQAASTETEASLRVFCHPASSGSSGRVLQVQSSSCSRPVHVPQPVSHTRMKSTSMPRNILLLRERLLALYSTVNVLRFEYLNAFPT